MFSHATFRFLRDLREHNDRAWFEANRARYERDAKEPLLAFVREMGPHLAALSPAFAVDERSAVFRIHRDVRFSKDKSPYKTHLAAQFRHVGTRGPKAEAVHAPGFYAHVAPEGPGEMDGVFCGFGMWQPEAAPLTKVRQAIVADPAGWARARDGLGLSGASLKRAPAGVPPEHPWADDLRRKDFIAVVTMSEADACAPDFVDRYAAACRRAAPFMGFLCRAVGLPF